MAGGDPTGSSIDSLVDPKAFDFGLRTHRNAGNAHARPSTIRQASKTLFSPDDAFIHTAETFEPLGIYASKTKVSTRKMHIIPPRTTNSAQRDVDNNSGRKLINRYEILRELGRGVHGKVKLGRNLDNGEFVAIKIVQRYSKRRRLGKTDIPDDKVKKEIAILKKVQHPNIVRLIEVIDDPDIAKVYIVLEFCEQKELIWRAEGLQHVVLLEYFSYERDSNSAPEHRRGVADVGQTEKAIYACWNLEQVKVAYDSGLTNLWNLECVVGSKESAKPAQLQTGSASRRPRQHPKGTSQSDDSDGPVAESLSSRARDEARIELCGASSSGERWPQSLTSLVQNGTNYNTSSRAVETMDMRVPMDSRYVPTLTLDECRIVIREALVGLEYLHYNGIIHRDIKPENLLRTGNNRVKISDFGVSYLGKPIRDSEGSENVSEAESADLEDDAAFAKTVGTPAFYAPELCKLDIDSDAPVAKHQVDIWALGITLYCMIFARTPFHADNEFALMKRIREDEIFIPGARLKAIDTASRHRHSNQFTLHNQRRNPPDFEHEPVDEELRDLLKRLFQKDPSKRITIREIKHHPWILRDLQHYTTPDAWIDTTDPSRVGLGKKIEVSSQELQDAVIPINTIMGRIKSISKRATSALGLGRRRRRGQSSASSEAGSSTMSMAELSSSDRPSSSKLRVESELEHPLSHSEIATFAPKRSNTGGFSQTLAPPLENLPDIGGEHSSRPAMPDRHISEASTTASFVTVRPIDTDGSRSSALPTSLAALPGSPSRDHIFDQVIEQAPSKLQTRHEGNVVFAYPFPSSVSSPKIFESVQDRPVANAAISRNSSFPSGLGQEVVFEYLEVPTKSTSSEPERPEQLSRYMSPGTLGHVKNDHQEAGVRTPIMLSSRNRIDQSSEWRRQCGATVSSPQTWSSLTEDPPHLIHFHKRPDPWCVAKQRSASDVITPSVSRLMAYRNNHERSAEPSAVRRSRQSRGSMSAAWHDVYEPSRCLSTSLPSFSSVPFSHLSYHYNDRLYDINDLYSEVWERRRSRLEHMDKSAHNGESVASLASDDGYYGDNDWDRDATNSSDAFPRLDDSDDSDGEFLSMPGKQHEIDAESILKYGVSSTAPKFRSSRREAVKANRSHHKGTR